jgi:hypothetical protein
VTSNVPGLRSRYSYSLRAGWFGVRLPVRERVFILHTRPDRVWSLPSLLYKGYRGFFPGVNWPECEVNHSPQCSDKVRNEWIYTSQHVPVWHVYGETFIWPSKCFEPVNRNSDLLPTPLTSAYRMLCNMECWYTASDKSCDTGTCS